MFSLFHRLRGLHYRFPANFSTYAELPESLLSSWATVPKQRIISKQSACLPARGKKKEWDRYSFALVQVFVSWMRFILFTACYFSVETVFYFRPTSSGHVWVDESCAWPKEMSNVSRACAAREAIRMGKCDRNISVARFLHGWTVLRASQRREGNVSLQGLPLCSVVKVGGGSKVSQWKRRWMRNT